MDAALAAARSIRSRRRRGFRATRIWSSRRPSAGAAIERRPASGGARREPPGASRGNARYAIGALSLAVGMLGLTYAAVPFYTLFCRATGYEGTPQRAAAGDDGPAGDRVLRVAFDANVAPGLPWRFEPETDAVHLRTGKTVTVFFRAQNLSDREVAAQAAFNVTPEVSGALVRQGPVLLLQRAAARAARDGGVAGRVLSRPEARERPVDGRGPVDHAVLHLVRRARGPGFTRLREARGPSRMT